jgi:uncharacterized coiled-coil DUF342 family protein
MTALASYIIGLGGLAISALTLIISYLRGSKKDAAEEQALADKLENIGLGVSTLNTKLDNISEKIDNHGNRITALETEMNNIYRRLDRVESRYETLYGKEV